MKGKYSHEWLQSFFDEKIPSADKVVDGLTNHSFEVEGVEEVNGDTIYELDITPDRSLDSLAHYGIAKEIAMIFSLKLKVKYFENKFDFGEDASYINTDKCDRYTILKIENISISETPKEIKDRLERLGQKSINPIVDLSNYILFDIGQPTHSFDAEKVSGNFGVRQAKDGEKLVLLGGKEVSLSVEDIVITDEDRAVALAGIKGGEDTKTDSDTKSIYLEIASFDSSSIRRTMRRLDCITDASLRFSQGIPPEIVDYSVSRAAEVFSKYGEITKSFDSRRMKLRNQRKTGISVSEVNSVLGTDCSVEDLKNIFDRLQFSYEYISPRDRFVEIAREHLGKRYVYGSSVLKDAPETFDCSSLVCYAAAHSGLSVPRMAINQCMSCRYAKDPKPGDLLFSVSTDSKSLAKKESVYEEGFPVSTGKMDIGINHVSIMSGEDTQIEAAGDTSENMVFESKINKEDILLSGDIFGDEKRFVITVPNERYDILHGSDLIEEIGRVIGYSSIKSNPPKKIRDHVVNKKFAKKMCLLKQLSSLGFSEVMTHSFNEKGNISVEKAVSSEKTCLRNNLRDGIEESLKLNSYNGELLGLDKIMIMEIGNVFTKNGEETHLALGVINTLGRKKVDKKDIEKKVKDIFPIEGGFENNVWEVNMDDIDISPDKYDLPPAIGDVNYVQSSQYPFVLRDLSVFIPNNESVEEVKDFIEKNISKYLKKINLFDVFEKDGKTSYAFRIVFQSDNKTLNDEKINEQMESLYERLKEKKFEIR